ncbi:MAG: hypothetical protein IJO88_06990 [Oscillospiraceae bacterium]|nr:hypothetical protein [Oscillospiraceae bacterium]
MTAQKKQQLRRMLQEARLHLLHKDYDFAEPLLELRYVAVSGMDRISTNGRCIYFDPNWLQKLSPYALRFILSHQLMHIRLEHLDRPAFYQGDRWHLACDIIANSRLRELGWIDDKLPGIGTIYHETFFPRTEGAHLSPTEAFHQTPFDPSCEPSARRRKYMVDSDCFWTENDDCGALGIVVLSPEDEDPEDLILPAEDHEPDIVLRRSPYRPILPPTPPTERSDPDDSPLAALSVMTAELSQSLSALRDTKDRMQQFSDCTDRSWQRACAANVPWRELLHRFLQPDLCDYSFLPPDRRRGGCFFLPSFRKVVPTLKDVLFLVDTSASMDVRVLDTVYGEICSAIGQFGGELHGLLGFFDTAVYAPIPFSSVTELSGICPRGGGGTDLSAAVDAVLTMHDRLSAAVIVTDGQDTFPPPSDIPLLWLLTDRSISPPWGLAAYL